ncbi:PD-(D/E)XK nuclease family transposase [bacterium]|nr:PD-(D/E)XK nuclease family transposase [bacterium]
MTLNLREPSDREKYLKSLRPIDDIMFRTCARETAWCQEVLSAIMEDSLLQVIKCRTQCFFDNFKRRAVTLDAVCLLGNGQTVNIEVQKGSEEDHQRRVRFHEALMTARLTPPGTEFKNIPDICTVYICAFDIFKRDRALYHVDRNLREGGERLYNGHTEIYVNALARDGSRAAELMKIFIDPNAYNYDLFPEVSDSKYQCLHTQEGRKRMDAVLENYLQTYVGDIETARAEGEKRGERRGELRGIAKGEKLGEKRGRILSAVELFKEGIFGLADASRRVGMSEAEFKAFMEQLEKEAE